MSKSTELTDPDGVLVSVAPAPGGTPYAEDTVAIRTGGGRVAWVSARELIAAVEKAAGLELFIMDGPIHRSIYGADPEGHATPMTEEAPSEPEPLWTEVRERPARAVKVTPELVRTLAGDNVPPELAGLEPEFDRATGEPVGVIAFDRPGLATIGRYVVLSGAHGTSVLKPEEFERLFEVAA